MKFKRQIPNLITWSRLGLLIGSLTSFILGNYPLTLSLFMASAATDKIDGFLARKLNCVSSFGAKLDAICDKALSVIGGAITIPLGGKEFIIPVSLEVAIMAYNFYRYKIKKQDIKTTPTGKVKTALLDTTMAMGIAKPLIKFHPLIYTTALVSTSIAQLATITSYAKDDMRQEYAKKEQQENIEKENINNVEPKEKPMTRVRK